MPVKYRYQLDATLIFFCGLIFFTLGLHHQEIIGFESRFYLFALEMWRHGFSWFPMTYHEPYPDYPVTSTVFIYSFAKLFGTLNKWIAVLPSAIAAAFTLSLTYLVGALQDRRWGWYGAGFLLFTLAFLLEARTISLDMYVTAFTAGIFYFIYSAKFSIRSPSWPIILVLLVMSFAVRGPIGIVVPAGVMGIFYLLEKDWKLFFVSGFTALLLLILCTSILLWIAHHVGGDVLMQKVLRMQILGRLAENQTPPFYFYFWESLGAYAITYPLAILVLLGCTRALWRDKISARMQFLRLLLGWVLIIMLGLSIPADKKIRYILPIAPALALICSYLLITIQTGYLNYLKKIFYGLCWFFPLLSLGVLSVCYHQEVDLNYPLLTLFFVIAQLGMFISLSQTRHFFLAVLTFFFSYVFIAEKINLNANNTKYFVQGIEEVRDARHAKLAFYREGRDGFVIKYLINMPREEQPLFITDINAISTKPMMVVTSIENFNALSQKVRQSLEPVLKGKIGRDNVAVFLIKP